MGEFYLVSIQILACVTLYGQSYGVLSMESKLTRSINFSHVMFEMDFLAVVHMIKSGKINSESLKPMIRELSSMLRDTRVHREATSWVDFFGKFES